MSLSVRIMTVADLHRSKSLISEMRAAIARVKPSVLALVGDFLDFSSISAVQLSTTELATVFASLNVPTVLHVRGNHEDFAWFEYQDAWAATGNPLIKLHGGAFDIGPVVITGFPCLMGDDTAFTADLPELPARPSGWLAKLVTDYGSAMRTIWLMHEPPAGTPLSQPNSPVAGNQEWRTAIKRFMPLLTISGHDHRTPIASGRWWHRIDGTTCVNVGQTDDGPLHFCLVQAEFASSKPSLPKKMEITAMPWNETLQVYPPAAPGGSR